MKACALDPAGAHANILSFSRKGDKGDRIFWLIWQSDNSGSKWISLGLIIWLDYLKILTSPLVNMEDPDHLLPSKNFRKSSAEVTVGTGSAWEQHCSRDHLSRLLGEGLVGSPGWGSSLGKNREALKAEDTWQTVSQQMRETGKRGEAEEHRDCLCHVRPGHTARQTCVQFGSTTCRLYDLNKSPYQPWFSHL